MQKINLENWGNQIQEIHLPRWQELPEFELYMDQVINLVDRYLSSMMTSEKAHLLSSAMVNNYVKHKLIPAPVKKRYSREHLAYLMMITILKQVLSIPDIKALIDMQLEVAQADEVYNHFCEAQESALKEVTQVINRDKITNENYKFDFRQIALYSSTQSFAQKMLAEKIIFDNKGEDSVNSDGKA
ncbi:MULTISPECIES: DUF1836 domain-containing protein [Enterococcus]|uniref:DUF1836 domain-containing protein n=1 Tax=Enterococcus alishanensis TaxID=1303817 RepID=A0ABS6T908_9ENTE|nr:DUF1836 domain-containing protein [Enterococcus alishanensis]MBV7389383.1 DUF1836 domain-containing protein [Enterococcus alishanensis]